jgi:hypothetical protein
MLNDRQLNELFVTAGQGFRSLLRQEVITSHELAPLTPKERYAIALEWWAKCDDQAREQLCNDPIDKIRRLALTRQSASLHPAQAAWPVRSAGDQVQRGL